MKITKINLYQVSLPMKEGAYSWSNQSFAAFDSTVVEIQTDEGITGVGKICPLGPADRSVICLAGVCRMKCEWFRMLSDVNLYMEQPCKTYWECRVVRDHSHHPKVLDECMDSLQAVLRGSRERAMDVVNLKISRMGGRIDR